MMSERVKIRKANVRLRGIPRRIIGKRMTVNDENPPLWRRKSSCVMIANDPTSPGKGANDQCTCIKE
jgi:hypothetical protein